MKKLILILALGIFSYSVNAKYKLWEGADNQAQIDSRYMFNYMDTDKDGKLSLAEYKGMRVTQDVKQKIRKAKADGIYKAPEEEFKIMDADEDGFITPEDLSNYLSVRGY